MKELECENGPIWTKFEVSTKGLDEDVSTYGADPWGSESSFGIRVPSANVGPNDTLGADRYLVLLALAYFQANEEVHLMSARQFISIGYATPTSGDAGSVANPLVELQVESPQWRFQNGGNVSWHIIRLPPTQLNNFAPLTTFNHDSEAYFWSGTPALLSRHFAAAGYIPPWNGILPSMVPVASDLLNFYDLRFPWQDRPSEDDIGAFFDGPCTVAFLASIRQPDITQGALPVIPTAQLPFVCREDAFVATAMQGGVAHPEMVKYTRVAGSLIFQKRLKTSQFTDDDPCKTCGRLGHSTPKPPSFEGGK